MQDEEKIREVVAEKHEVRLTSVYVPFEPEGDGTISDREALEAINRIRNSIVGLQNINWSEHIYPLVAILNRAGLEGISYPENKANYGTCLQQRNDAIKLLKESPSMRGTSDWQRLTEVFLKQIGADS